jgi:serine protease Do
VKRLPLLVALLVAGCNVLQKSSGPSGSASALPSGAVPVASNAAYPPTPPVQPAPPTAVGTLPSLAPLVGKAGPSVVTIKAFMQRQNAFGRGALEERGVGSGFIYDPKGFVLTNNHVIEEADSLVVKLDDGREVGATVVGADKPTDIAVLRIEADKLTAIAIGDSRAVEVGDWVVAIGNPFGLEHTVSAGIVSAKGRTREDVKGLDPAGYFNFIQTDASINPGNSGGPLLNMQGQVVGINAAVRANANNIGFAIPMEMVVQLLPMLLRDGRVTRSAIGILVDEVSSADAEKLGENGRHGARVLKILAGGAADQAGLAPGDVILGFDGKPVKNPNELRWLASIAGVKRTVSLRIVRGERTFDLRVTLGELTE